MRPRDGSPAGEAGLRAEGRKEERGLSPTCPSLLRPRKLTLKGYRQYWVLFKETTLSYYKSQDEAPGDPIQQLNLKGELTGQGLVGAPPGPPMGWAGECCHLASASS